MSNKYLLAIDNIRLMERFKPLQDARRVKLRLRNRESLLGPQKHIQLASRAVVHTDCCVALAGDRELLLDEELGDALRALKVEHHLAGLLLLELLLLLTTHMPRTRTVILLLHYELLVSVGCHLVDVL